MTGAVLSLLFPAVTIKHRTAVHLTYTSKPSKHFTTHSPFKVNVHIHKLQLTSLNTLQTMKTIFRLPQAMSLISV